MDGIVEESSSDSTVKDNRACYSKDVTNTSAPLYSFLHQADFAQYIADKYDSTIIALAPAEGQAPERILQMEAKCFPAEFPDGYNTFVATREKQIRSPSRYFNARLFFCR